MRRAIHWHWRCVVLKPATVITATAFVAGLCILSFAVGAIHAGSDSRIPTLSVSAAVKTDSHLAADNVEPAEQQEHPKTMETATVPQKPLEAAAEAQPVELSSETEAAPSQKTETPDEWQTIRMRVTAYCPCPKCCGEYSDGITACGHKVHAGDTFVAADSRFAFYTDMIIEGYNNSHPVKVLDRGGAIKGNKLDVFFMTHQEALEWGVHYIDVKVRHAKAS